MLVYEKCSINKDELKKNWIDPNWTYCVKWAECPFQPVKHHTTLIIAVFCQSKTYTGELSLPCGAVVSTPAWFRAADCGLFTPHLHWLALERWKRGLCGLVQTVVNLGLTGSAVRCVHNCALKMPQMQSIFHVVLFKSTVTIIIHYTRLKAVQNWT